MRKILIFPLFAFLCFFTVFGFLYFFVGAQASNSLESVPQDTLETMPSETPNSGDLTPQPEFLSPSKNQKIQGDILLKIQIENASGVEFNLRKVQSLTPIYLGQGTLVDDVWELSWASASTPNGQYTLFLKVKNTYGEYEAGAVKIKVDNLESPKASTEIQARVEKAQQEIRIGQAQLLDQENKKETEIVNLQQNLAQEIQTIVPSEQTSATEVAFQQQASQLPAKIKQFSDKTKEETQTQAEITDKNQTKNDLKKQIEKATNNLSEVKNIEAKATATSSAVVLENIKQDKEKKLEDIQQESQQIEQDVVSLNQQLVQIKKDKAVARQEVKDTVAVTEIVQDFTGLVEQTQLNNKVQVMNQEIDKRLDDLEQDNAQEVQKIYEQTKVLAMDSDMDNLSDAEEIQYHTDPLNPDSDGDGYLDGVEVSNGFNPQDSSPTQKIVYEEPTKSKAPISDTYQVTSVHLTPGKKLEIYGKGLPNSFVTLYVYSLPLVLVTKTDSQGNFDYILDKPLPDGGHKIYVAVTDNNGQIVARSEIFNFIKTPLAVAAVSPSSLSASTDVLFSSTARLQKLYTLLIIILVFSSLSIALVLIGLFLGRKGQKGEMNS